MRRTVLTISVVLLAVLALLAVGCGGGGEPAGEAGSGAQADTGSPVGQAEVAACAANRRAISSAAQQYQAVKGQAPASVQQLVPEFLPSIPVCPSGGTYSLSGTRVVCSVHGS